MTIRDTVLCNGLKVPKGTKVIVSAHHSWDNSIYPNADKFDGYRFLRLRDEGSTTAQFATTSPSTIGFGHGHLACPGRFFAGDEIKIALSHIILKYDFRLVPGTKLKVNPSGFVSAADATGCIMVRRRKEEIRI
jgi:cytochrome P450 monooxygenase-1